MSASDVLDQMKQEAKEEMKSPMTRIHYMGKGKLAVIDAVADLVYETESALRELRASNDRARRNSGFGRGDSMG